MEIEPPQFTKPDPDSGDIFSGCATGCACQIFCFLLGLLVSNFTGPGKLGGFLVIGWGFTQWIVLLPVIRMRKAEGQTKTVQGILISGFLGVLLSSACAAMMLGGR